MPEKPTWRFRMIEEDQKHVEPTHREHLAPRGSVEPLVREAIQNSLDVTVEGRPTKVVFTLGQATAHDARSFFDALRPHLEAISASLPEGLPTSGDAIRFLAIEDYNTTGLEGDPALRKQLDANGKKNHFFRFWHSVGQSTGAFKRRGSWGVGKVVFSNASRTRTFFGLTLRSGDASPLLMGEAGLTIHTLPGGTAEYDWYGYYAAHEQRHSHFVPLPVRDPSIVARFARVFGLTRESPGLSILVPYLREEVKIDEVAQTIIEQYFLPILSGRLEVVVRNGSQPIDIDRTTIDEAISRISWSERGLSTRQEMAALLQLARWQIALPVDDYIQLNQVGTNGTYSLGTEAFPDGALRRISDEFALGKRVAVRMPICVRPKQSPVAEEEVRIVLEREEGLRVSDVPHLRCGINISKMRESAGPGVRGLLIVGNDPDRQGELDKLLQASEGPAHTNWELRGEGYDKAKSLYDEAYKIIQFMRGCVRNFTDLLATPPDAQDTRTLSTFFPDYDAPGSADARRDSQLEGPVDRDTGGSEVPTQLPVGVIEGVVRSLLPAFREVRPVAAATVQLTVFDGSEKSITTDAEGKFRFERLTPAEYILAAKKEGLGEARKRVDLPLEHGVRADLFLRPEQAPKMFVKVPLEDGFAIRGNPDYPGTLRPVRVKMAYAAWGGSKSHTEADFSLNGTGLQVSFSGVHESERGQLVGGPNVLHFTPTTPEFYVEVRGFDANRALHADARALDEETLKMEATE